MSEMGTSTETRSRRRIRLAVESRGHQLATLSWTPWGPASEMGGPEGGWYGTTTKPYESSTWPGNEIMGLSTEEVLAWIDAFMQPSEPCDCPPRRLTWVPLKGDPDEPLHRPGCRWHISYRLRWWQ